jgi:hypothetical protein
MVVRWKSTYLWSFYSYHFPTTTSDTNTIQPRLQTTRVLIHNVRSLYVSLHSHCTCPYIHCTPTVRVLIFTAPTERPVCVCPLNLRTRWTLAVNTCCRRGRAVKTRDEDVKSRDEDSRTRWSLAVVTADTCGEDLLQSQLDCAILLLWMWVYSFEV